ncbi:MerR family transcriptional regulator [Clostridium oceanicum]|uniref:HTH merR-type domain-containing protein n=1 Tax=Clostridium oceanicum TaxID=1543 RepID=A0ABN1JJY3_9CLOT
MRKLLTISEASKFLSISTHAIRHYEEEGLVYPSKRSEKGYRLYDYDNIYMLSFVMLLRECETPIKEIRSLLKDYSSKKYIDTMVNTRTKIDNEIKRLENLKTEIDHILKPTSKDYEFKIKNLPERLFTPIKTIDYDMDCSIKEIYDLYKKYNVDTTNSFKEDLYHIIDDKNIRFCIPYKIKNLPSTIYPKGKYLCYGFSANNEDVIKEEIQKFFKYVKDNKLQEDSELLLIDEMKNALTKDNDYSIKLQMKIK